MQQHRHRENAYKRPSAVKTGFFDEMSKMYLKLFIIIHLFLNKYQCCF